PAPPTATGGARVPVSCCGPCWSTGRWPGPYPAGSVLMMTFVGGRHVRTGEPVALDPIEADAWGLALVPPGFEEYALRLGTIAKFSAGVRHYRMVVASDGTACVMPPADKEVLLTSMG
ncbi:hypothetical protein ABZ589_38880, partial [Streptomyces sp. NPDC013313]|uniref:hypothetical protein n=1 Tax=Streptomyces sp. NPDC013313 TaxID=3155603 RepID=UPI0033C5D9B6